MSNTNPTQRKMVLEHLETYGSITQREASIEYSVERLPSRIHELRRMGYPILSETVYAKNKFGKKCHYSKYYLAKEDDGVGRCEVDQDCH